jgi:nifR3 family TIM-barrel protein
MEPTYSIGNLPIYGDLILAPMDGISDIPFRSLCRRFGSAISYTPFVRARDLLLNQPRAWDELKFLPSERPVAFQIYDESETRLLEATMRIERLQPDFIDINMGCPIRKISNRGAGAGMLRDPDKIARIVRSLSKAVSVPITAKIRLGWDENEMNYLEVCRAIEDNGGAMIAVHARTRSQGYRHDADWDAIADIKDAVGIPVVGNGDVRTPMDIDRMIAHTGCDAVMIGRSAIGNPWIFQRKASQEIPPDDVVEMINEHLDQMMDYYDYEKGLLNFRKHLSRYLNALDLDDNLRKNLLTTTDREVVRALLSEFSTLNLQIA